MAKTDYSDALKRCLEDLEARIDPDQEERLLAEWTAFCNGDCPDDVFVPRRDRPAPPQTDWAAISVNEALEDFDAMALQQYNGWCSRPLASGDGHVLCVRCNYGTGIMPRLFGAELFLMDDELDTLPTSRPLGGADAVRKLLDDGMPDLRRGYGAQVLEMGASFATVAHVYPNIGRYVHIYHPDLQGPLDIVELLWGSGVFYDLYDSPELVKDLLDLVTATYIAFMREWQRIVSPADGPAAHWGIMHGGRIMIRDDSAMNLSPEMVEEFALPWDQKLLDEFGGGAVHFCGRGDHYIRALSRLRGLHAVNMSQPEYNDMEAIYAATVDRGINIVELRPDAVQAAREAGRRLHGRVHTSGPLPE